MPAGWILGPGPGDKIPCLIFLTLVINTLNFFWKQMQQNCTMILKILMSWLLEMVKKIKKSPAAAGFLTTLGYGAIDGEKGIFLFVSI